MKIRPLLILLLFILSAGILVWIYHAATRTPRPQQSPWAEIAADLERCGRRKHLQSAQFAYFATIAQEEQQPDAARLFRALAHAEQLHEQGCAQAVARLGGSYSPPTKAVVFRRRTTDNLRRSIDYKRQLLREPTDSAIHHALAAGNRYAARILIRATAGDRQQVQLLERLLDGRQQSRDSNRGYRVCPQCGHVCAADDCDPFCPWCLTDASIFAVF